MSFLVQSQVALAPLTTLKTGGKASHLVAVESIEELEKAVTFAEQEGLPFYILGGGSNMLVADEGYRGLIIHMQIQGMTYAPKNDDTILATIGAGEVLDSCIADTVARGYWGLENLSCIPGSVGATPVQNVGAYGVEVSDIISCVTVFDTHTKKILSLSNEECGFSYRHSRFKEKNNLVIVDVTFMLSMKPLPKLAYADLGTRTPLNPAPQDVRTVVTAIRAEKFPDWTVIGTAGSFFKNPLLTSNHVTALLFKYPDIPTYPSKDGLTKISLGYILDKICGLKGFAIGPVRLYEKQALVLVAEKGATTADIKNFVKIISETVFEKTAVRIYQEVTEI
jgi:UDP-N-acetylmuramate dehydrogenase